MIIWLNGCFDILHHGHFRMIEYASSLGGKLVIGIDGDERVKSMKGEDRPYHNEEERRFNLKSIKGVDIVFIFNSDEELRKLIKVTQPDIFVIGGDYKDKPIIGSEYVKKIVYFDRLENFSTTDILNYEHNNNR